MLTVMGGGAVRESLHTFILLDQKTSANMTKTAFDVFRSTHTIGSRGILIPPPPLRSRFVETAAALMASTAQSSLILPPTVVVIRLQEN